MRRSEIYKIILLDIIDRIQSEGKISDDDATDKKAIINFTIPIVDREWFNGIDTGIYKHFIDSIVSFDATVDDPEEDTPGYVEVFEAPNDCGHEIKSFEINDLISGIRMITGLKLNEFISSAAPDERVVSHFTKIWLKIKDETQKKNKFWDICSSIDSKKYYVISDIPINSDKAWDAYAYAYLYKVKTDKFPRPLGLDYPSTNEIQGNLHFDDRTPYRQYFDIFHVLSETKHCEDLLKRYLHIYQVIEDLVYRCRITKLATPELAKRGFVRHLAKITKDINDNEFDTLKKGMAEIFDDPSTLITDVELDPYKEFLENHFGIKKNSQHNADKVVKIIYQLRNCIVHNKHTEFHFAYGNFKDYKDIAPLIKLLIKRLEIQVLQLLNDNNRKGIDYNTQTIKVY